jgi:hypothetical protein
MPRQTKKRRRCCGWASLAPKGQLYIDIARLFRREFQGLGRQEAKTTRDEHIWEGLDAYVQRRNRVVVNLPTIGDLGLETGDSRL